MSSVFASVAVPLSLCMGPRLMPESCVFWQRGGNDVDRRGNNNENTIKSRLHRLSGKKKKKVEKNLQGVAIKYEIYVLKLSYLSCFH